MSTALDRIYEGDWNVACNDWPGSHPPTLRELRKAAFDRAREIEERNVRSQSPTWPHVLDFARKMEAKLSTAKNRGKGNREGWVSCSVQFLSDRLDDEVYELSLAIAAGLPPEEVVSECCDVANFAMMLSDKITFDLESMRGDTKKCGGPQIGLKNG